MSKDDLVVEIAKRLASLPRLDPDWRSLAIVFTFEGKHPSNFGYCYTGPGDADWTAVSNRSDELDDDVARLREEMTAESGHAWTQALFRLKRDAQALSFDFAYDGKRWQATPQNVDATVKALRP